MARRSNVVVAHTVGLDRICPLHVILSPLLGRVLLLIGRNGAVRGGPVLEHGGPPDEGLAADVAEVGRRLALVPPHVDLRVGRYKTCQTYRDLQLIVSSWLGDICSCCSSNVLSGYMYLATCLGPRQVLGFAKLLVHKWKQMEAKHVFV